MLHDNLILFESLLGGAEWMFQHDNASSYAFKSSQGWLKKNKVDVLPWFIQIQI